MSDNAMKPVAWKPDPLWPPVIVDLAKQIAAGVDCRFALHDAW